MSRPLVDRKDFPLLTNNPDLHYLDSAATSQKPKAVLDAMRHYYEHDNANPHRGAYDLSARATERYHQARARIAKFVGVADADTLIFVRGTTEALNLVAWTWAKANVQSGDEIVVTGMEHHANFVPWQQVALEKKAVLRIARVTADGSIDLDDLRSLVSAKT
jgi:cysteine desulfurase/selenocysteine lyase